MSAKGDKKHHRVIVFSTPTCPHCRSAKRYLEQQGVSYVDVDVSRSGAPVNRACRSWRLTGGWWWASTAPRLTACWVWDAGARMRKRLSPQAEAQPTG